MTKKMQKKQNKNVARRQCNLNWQGSRIDDVEAANQIFGTNEVEIKQNPWKLSDFSGRLIMS